MEGEGGQQMCPVCTLYLRPGMTLHDHLFTHPKDQVIDALVRLAATPGGAGAVSSTATINTNSQFTAITYRQFQTLTTSVAEPMMLNPCLVSNTPAFTSGVIRSSVPLLSYPYYPSDQQSSSNFHEQNRIDSNTQCSYSFATQTTQTTQTNASPLQINNSPFHEANCETVQQKEENNTNYEPSVDPFLNDRADNPNERRNDSLICSNLPNNRDSRGRASISSNSCTTPRSVDKSVLENINTDNPYEDEIIHEEEIESFVEEGADNVHDTTIDPFVNGGIEDVHETTIDAFNRIRNANDATIETFVEKIHERTKQSDHMDNILHRVEKNGKSFVPKSPSLSTVISNTHRLIANDPSLDDLRAEEVEDYGDDNDYGNISPNRSSPVSDVSNWSAGSGLRVRQDLSNLDDQGSNNCILYVQQNSNASEYVTSDPYNGEPEQQETEAQLTDLNTVNYSMVLNYSTNEQLANMSIEDIEGKEDNSMYSAPLNIHSDELMPPRGELSGQESLGATENSVWEINEPEPSEKNYTERWPLDVDVRGSYSSVRCLECDMTFGCVKERRLHVQSVHKTPQHTQVKTDEKTRHVLKKAEIIKIKQEKFNIKTEASVRTCVECGLELQSIKELRKHKKNVHEEKKKCGTCDLVFDNFILLRDHLAKVHPIECNVCGKLSTSRSAANIHSKCHLKFKPYQCTVCDKSFVTQLKLSDHNNIHSGEAPYKCSMCDLSFKRQSNLIQHKNFRHLKIKKKIKDYFCHCGEIFHSIKKLEWHKETHDPKPKQCMYCSERYVHATSLTRHIRHTHDSTYLPKPTRSLNTMCPVCKITCIRTSLVQHMKIHSGDKPFHCNVCTKDFSTNWNLQMHKWTHASRNSKPFKCKQCKCAFYLLSSYQAHMRSHRNIRPYTCNYCGRQFIRKFNCMRHVKEHETNKSYGCDVCSKKFHRSYYLTEHMRTHTGVKPYTCHICSKTSSTKSNHNKHVRTHHAREPMNTEG